MVVHTFRNQSTLFSQPGGFWRVKYDLQAEHNEHVAALIKTCKRYAKTAVKLFTSLVWSDQTSFCQIH